MKKDRVVADVTTPNGRTTRVDFTTDAVNYDSDLANLREIWGDENVKEIKQR
jgi:hypothetical protein